MAYVLALIAALLAAFIVALLVGVFANLFSLIPRAGIRKWIVIGATPFVAFLFLSLVGWAILLWQGFSGEVRPLKDAYRALPSTTILYALPAVVALISLIAFSVSAFLPVKGEPYVPRGARWNLVWFLKWIGLLVVVFVLGAVVQDYELCWRLKSLEARADQLAAELQPSEVPDADNAALHYQRIVKLLDAPEFRAGAVERISKLLEQCGPLDEEATAFFESFEPILAEFEAAAKCKAARFPDATVSKSLIDETEPRIHESSAFRCLQLYAKYQICQQRPGEAIKCIRILQAWCRHLQADPRSVNSLHFRFAIQSNLELLQSIAANDTPVPADGLRSIITGPLPIDRMHQAAVEWERTLCFKTIVVSFDGRLYRSPRLAGSAFIGENTVAGTACRVIIRFVFARDDLAAIQAQFAPLDTPYDRTTWRYAGGDYSLKPEGKFTRTLRSFVSHRRMFDEAESNRRLCNIAIAAKLYRQEHGAWPSDLNQLAPNYLPEVPLDAETETPFALKAIEGGLIVWANGSTEDFEKAESEGKFWEATTYTHAPILFLGEALRLSKEPSAPPPADETPVE